MFALFQGLKYVYNEHIRNVCFGNGTFSYHYCFIS